MDTNDMRGGVKLKAFGVLKWDEDDGYSFSPLIYFTREEAATFGPTYKEDKVVEIEITYQNPTIEK